MKDVNPWFVVGALGVVAALFFISQQGSTTSKTNTSQGTDSTSTNGVSSSVGSGVLGFVDANTGVAWALSSADQWIAVLPQGVLPPNYTPGNAFITGSPFAGSNTGLF